MKKRCLGIICLLLISCTGYSQETLDLFPDQPGSLTYWSEARSMPRPLRIHYLKVSLTAGGLEVIALPGEDPDGPGPAESQLTAPTELVKRFHAIAAVNANAFAGVSGDRKQGPNWYEGQPVDMHGMVASAGNIVSPFENGRTAFWLDALHKPHIGVPALPGSVIEAVADWFSPLLIHAEMIPDAADHVLHPRTAVGFDGTGTWLLMVVVDGRQPGFSEGVSLYELAQILQSRGCSESINLDGGGSSIMLITEPGKETRTANSPSDKGHRPVPVMIGVRKSERF